MMPMDPPLLIVFEQQVDFNLSKFLDSLCEYGVSVNSRKYSDLTMKEVVHEGMTFLLSHHSESDQHDQSSGAQLSPVFCGPQTAGYSAIGISIGDHIANGKHTSPVNRAILKLGQVIGQLLDANKIIWTPAGVIAGFEFYSDSVNQYLEGGPLPVLVQIRIDDKNDNTMETTGLQYFSDQEISIKSPAELSKPDQVKRLVRIAHDVATNGRVDSTIETNGLAENETISFQPSEDLQRLNVVVSINR